MVFCQLQDAPQPWSMAPFSQECKRAFAVHLAATTSRLPLRICGLQNVTLSLLLAGYDTTAWSYLVLLVLLPQLPARIIQRLREEQQQVLPMLALSSLLVQMLFGRQPAGLAMLCMQAIASHRSCMHAMRPSRARRTFLQVDQPAQWTGLAGAKASPYSLCHNIVYLVVGR